MLAENQLPIHRHRSIHTFCCVNPALFVSGLELLTLQKLYENEGWLLVRSHKAGCRGSRSAEVRLFLH
jgi:hypothetical protein